MVANYSELPASQKKNFKKDSRAAPKVFWLTQWSVLLIFQNPALNLAGSINTQEWNVQP